LPRRGRGESYSIRRKPSEAKGETRGDRRDQGEKMKKISRRRGKGVFRTKKASESKKNFINLKKGCRYRKGN